ncbi:MAG: alanine--tRNA ligase [Candidatus Nanopelagicales bacterium]
MKSAEIRQRFLDYFQTNGHTVVPSASLLLDDPTLLFVNAGMVPFKPYFLGSAVADYKRATSVQKCVRTLDIEEVGKTTRHASFFQMAGNFSFGDYFKEGAIPYAWELLTNPDIGYGFDESKLWVTVYTDDDEAEEIWHKKVGVPKNRIQRRGQADNFWSMGVPGPCGPCSEIYYDRGPEFGKEGGPIVDEDRYLEVWNLVFMQFERGEGAGKENYPILGELPAKNIDTGMGIERMAALLQGVDNIYEIDTTRAILDTASEITGVKYLANPQSDIALRVIADHSRTCAFLINDGVIPGNEGRGYVLRRLMRRVIRNMRVLGSNDPSIGALVTSAIASMKDQYPEFGQAEKRIVDISVNEEEAFSQTLASGTQIIDTAISSVRSDKKSTLTGDVAFQLHDTYGFPIDLTIEMAREAGITVDETRFRELMAQQRERAKADARARKLGLTSPTAYKNVMDKHGKTEFVGYDFSECETKITGIFQDGEEIRQASEGDFVEVILNASPFYAEGGGQLGDHGVITLSDNSTIEVFDVQSPVQGVIVHRAQVIKGVVEVGKEAFATIDQERRLAISRAHTATHMIHKAFREILGEAATQMGSENSPGRLRFDFPSPKAVGDMTLNEVEARVNNVLIEDLTVNAQYMSQDEARSIGAMALFGEKYGDRVRVISVGEWAKELCGGTHTPSTGNLGLIKFLSEGSIGSGIRRVEALVGTDAYKYLATEHMLLGNILQTLKSNPEEVVHKLTSTLQRLKDVEKELEELRLQKSVSEFKQTAAIETLASGATLRVSVLSPDLNFGQLRNLANALSLQTATLTILGSKSADNFNLVVHVNKDAKAIGIDAAVVISEINLRHTGKGGGNADFAQTTLSENLSNAEIVSIAKSILDLQ